MLICSILILDSVLISCRKEPSTEKVDLNQLTVEMAKEHYNKLLLGSKKENAISKSEEYKNTKHANFENAFVYQNSEFSFVEVPLILFMINACAFFLLSLTNIKKKF